MKSLLRQSQAGGFGQIIKVSILAFIVVSAFGIFDFIIPYFTENISENLAIIGLTVSLVYAASFVFEVPLGLAVDRFGRKKVLLLALLALAGIGVIYFFTKNIIQLMVMEFIFGIIAVAYWIPEGVLVRDYSPKEKLGTAEAVYLSFSQLGWIIGPLAAGLIAQKLDLQWGFVAFSVLMLSGFAYGTFALKKKKQDEEKPRRAAKLFVLVKSFTEYVETHKHALPLYFLSGAVNVWIGIEWVFVQIAGSNVFHLSEEAVGAILAAMMVVEGLLYFTSGYLMDKIGPKYIILSGFLLLFSSSYFAFLSTNKYMFAFFLLLSAGSVAWIVPGTEAIATRIIPEGRRGEMTGVFDSSKDFGLMLGPLAGGIIGQFLGGPMMPFIYVTVISGIAVFLTLKLWR